MFEEKGLIIDKENKKFKKYVTVLFFKFGDWKPLLKFSFVAITKRKGAKTLYSSRAMGNSFTAYGVLYCVYLCVDQKMKELVFKTENKHEAIKLATSSAKYLNLPVKN